MDTDDTIQLPHVHYRYGNLQYLPISISIRYLHCDSVPVYDGAHKVKQNEHLGLGVGSNFDQYRRVVRVSYWSSASHRPNEKFVVVGQRCQQFGGILTSGMETGTRFAVRFLLLGLERFKKHLKTHRTAEHANISSLFNGLVDG